MTDDHETDPLQSELPEHDHQASPPVDDFADASSTTEEAATISQESAVEDDVSGSQSEGKSRSKVPLLLGLVGLFVVVGGYAFWQFSRSSEPVTITANEGSKPSPQDAAPSADQQAAQVPLPPAMPPSPTQASPTSPSPPPSSVPPSDVANLYKPAADTTPTQAAPTQTAPIASAMPPLPPSPAQSQNGLNPTSQMQARAPAMMAPPSLPPVTSSNQGQLQSKVDALSARLDQVQKALDQANRQLSQVAAAESVSASQPSPNQEVEQRLSKVEYNLSQLEAKPPAVNKSESISAAAPVIHHVKSGQKPKPVKKTVVATHHKKPKAPVVQQAWVLRAATPNEAWISADASSSDLKHVGVGDTVEGIGHVKSIDQTASGWEIVGSDATIR